MSNNTNHETKLESPFKSDIGAESPTTVKPFDIDDDEVPESAVGVIEAPNLSGTIKLDNDAPNQLPLREPQPATSNLNAEETLKEAFPSIDLAVVKAVLRASGGLIEPAFNALLGMSDPEAAQELSNNPPPSQPPAVTSVGSTPLSQLEADERYARQLAYQYRYSDRSAALESTRNNSRGELAPGSGRSQNMQEERSFLEDDLPIIKDNLKKGFLETQNKVSNWITLLKKKIDGDDDDDDDETHQNHGHASRVNKFNDYGRKSDDFSPYDADPQVLGDDFAGIQMHSDGTIASQINKADKSQLKSIPIRSSTCYDPKTSINISPQKEIDSLTASSNYEPKIVSKQSKWQPISTVEPNPVSEADNDPFSLGDSDDEKETKDCVQGIELKPSVAEAVDKSLPMIKTDNKLENKSDRIETAIVPAAK